MIPQLPPPPPPQEIVILIDYPWAPGLINQRDDEHCAIMAVEDNVNDHIGEREQYRRCVILYSDKGV